MLIRTVLAVAFMAALMPARAHSAFHIMHLTEVMSGFNGDPDVQYVELELDLAGQNLVASTRLTAFNQDGTSHTVLVVTPGNVGISQLGAKILYATPEFEALHNRLFA